MHQIKPPGRIPPTAVLELWREYKQSGDSRVRDQLVFALAPIVRSVVYRKIREMPAHWQVEDLISSGLEALIRSIDRYDPAKGATLEQFVWTRIQGSVLDELRRFDWAPRSLRRLEREMNRAHERLTVLNGRSPSRAELAEALGVEQTELARLIGDLARSEIGSLNTLITNGEGSPAELVDSLPSVDPSWDPEQAAMRARAIAQFREAFNELPQRERHVAVLLHVKNLTLRETGAILGVSESRVCQIHGKLKRGLRERLEADAPLFREVA